VLLLLLLLSKRERPGQIKSTSTSTSRFAILLMLKIQFSARLCYDTRMNRVDRLVAIALRLQSRRLVRAEDLADYFEISIRTVSRDIAALGEAGVPIMAEAGVGYSLAKGYHLPPVMFTADEASALSLGAKLVERLTDASLRRPMESALAKI